ncbi:MAG: radical SAM protein [Myxococcales bacterium]|nr:radical SAM protein [Myxococcales bacterium]
MHVRELTADDHERPKPVYVVWEVTLQCDHACLHCGSRAARARPRELSTAELLGVADELVALGTREVTLIGGEAYLRPDLPVLIERLAQGGIRVGMQTGGFGLTPALLARLGEAGLVGVGLSIDGPEEAHDTLRGRRGSHAAVSRALEAALDATRVVTVNTQLNALTLPHLRDQYAHMAQAGVRGWRVQVTVPMGRAADRPEWLLQPWQVVEAIDTLAALQVEAAEATRAAGRPVGETMFIHGSNNLGYFGPHEELLRSEPGRPSAHWTGCPAGSCVMSIESDGTVKPCPSLPTAPYASGRVPDDSLEALWGDDESPMGFQRGGLRSGLWGFCEGCAFAEVCGGGCAWSAHAALGRPGNQPWCYHRASQLAKRGVRERLVRVQAPPGDPYDVGRFELVEEPLPS